MGQAKWRGTFEERKAAAVKRDTKVEERIKTPQPAEPRIRMPKPSPYLSLAALIGLGHGLGGNARFFR